MSNMSAIFANLYLLQKMTANDLVYFVEDDYLHQLPNFS